MQYGDNPMCPQGQMAWFTASRFSDIENLIASGKRASDVLPITAQKCSVQSCTWWTSNVLPVSECLSTPHILAVWLHVAPGPWQRPPYRFCYPSFRWFIIFPDKELWEPTIGELFRSPVSSSIREVWSFDWPSHGQAALANAPQLEKFSAISTAFPHLCSRWTYICLAAMADWGKAMAEFIHSQLQGRSLVAIGHSVGSIAVYHCSFTASQSRI